MKVTLKISCKYKFCFAVAINEIFELTSYYTRHWYQQVATSSWLLFPLISLRIWFAIIFETYKHVWVVLYEMIFLLIISYNDRCKLMIYIKRGYRGLVTKTTSIHQNHSISYSKCVVKGCFAIEMLFLNKSFHLKCKDCLNFKIKRLFLLISFYAILYIKVF